MKVGILFGGRSHEHEISIVSAIAISEKLSLETLYIFLDKEGDFYFIPKNVLKSKLFSSGEYSSYPKLTLKKGGFFQKGFFGENKIALDIVCNLIHGSEGEDGTLASMLDFYRIPFIGPRQEACVISYNKHLTKHFAQSLGIKTLPFQLLGQGDARNIDFPYPVIIKPLRLGSSIGVSVVQKQEGLDYALDVAFEFDNTVLVEPFMENIREFNLAGAHTKEQFFFSVIEEPQKEKILDFDKKYLDFSRTERVHEADIDADLVQLVQETFTTIYQAGFEGSLIRCDFFYDGESLYLNEINPVPGSLANYLFAHFEEVFVKLARSLPTPVNIPIEYRYINQIQAAKGK